MNTASTHYRAALLWQQIELPYLQVKTECGRSGKVLSIGPGQDYVMADLGELGICRVDTPDQAQRFSDQQAARARGADPFS